MKSTFLLVVFIALIITGFTRNTISPPASSIVVLPIEVMGPAGTVESVTLETTGTTDSLYLVGHSLGYHNSDPLWSGQIQRDGKASFRINGGPWTPISNAVASIRYPERAYLGIGGAFHTIRLALPISAAPGLVTIDFRFNGTEGMSSGFRILEIDLRNGTSSRIMPGQLIEDDPETWTAPIGGNAAAGRIAYNARNTLIENPLPGASIIVASCADCHADTGFDLKYYNYSNKAIIERTLFHGGIQQTGEDIAAYIRSVNLNRTDGRNTSPYARPWNPPYQPGPGLTDRGEDDWAAGAGLEWVLNSDDDIPRWIFANGNIPNDNPSDQDMRRVLHIGSWSDNEPGAFGNRLNHQNIPVAVQYPDWNGWLPDVSPLDAIDNFTSSDLWNKYLLLKTLFDTPSELESEIQIDRSFIRCTTGCGRQGIGNWFNDFGREFVTFPGLEASFNANIPYATQPALHHVGRLSMGQWQVVKMWELFNVNRMQNLTARRFGGITTPSPWVHAGSPLRFPGNGLNEDGSQQRVPFAWPEGSPGIFDLAPHKSGEPNFPSQSAYGGPTTHGPQSALMTYYFSSIWYDVQLTVGMDLSGYMANNGGAPIDWNYQTSLAKDVQNSSQVSQWWRMFRARAVAVQSRNNYYAQATTRFGYSFNYGPGFTSTNANYWEVLWMFPQPNGTGGSNYLVGDVQLSRQALENYWNEWTDFARSVPVDSWQRNPGPAGQCCGYQPATVQPNSYSGGNYFDPYADADNAYRLPALMQAWSMDPVVVDNVARWGESMYPLGNFEQWFITGTLPRGDVTSDGVVNLSDFLAALDIALGNLPFNTAADQYPFPNGDGQVDIRDVNVLGRALVIGQWPDGTVIF